MNKPNLTAPSLSVEAKNKEGDENTISNKRKSNSIILILIGIIICLILIILSLLLVPSPPSLETKKILRSETSIDKKILLEPEVNSELIINTDIEKEVSIKESLEEKDKQLIEINNKKIELNLKLEKETLDNNFNKIIDETLYAIEKHHYGQAEKKLNVAKKLKPEVSIIKDLRQRIIEASRQARIKNVLNKAWIEEKKEQWHRALNYYEEILKLDINMSQVLVKKQRVNNYIKISDILNKIINKPERLQNDKVFEAAGKSLQFVKLELINNKDLFYPMQQTPKLNKKISSAEKIIQQASIPVSLTIQSDNLTDIFVYKVGKFGKLLEKKLSLRLGSYTIVGSREGYRDYKKTLKISAGDSFVVIRVECKEEI